MPVSSAGMPYTLATPRMAARNPGEDAKRMAGFQEVNPSEMPNMSSETRSFIEPLLGAYQEGGKQVEGYYGKDNPYTQGGLESLLGKQGYAHAPSSLSEQFKSVGLKLPNAYGQDYYNVSHEDMGNKIAQYPNQQQDNSLYNTYTNFVSNLKPLSESLKNDWRTSKSGTDILYNNWMKFANSGFVPGLPSPEGWMYQAGSSDAPILSGGKMAPLTTTGSGKWTKGNDSIIYDPAKGYSLQHHTTGKEQFMEDLSSIATVGNIIGGVVLPGLGTSWMGLAGNAANNLGMTLPTSGLSTASFGLSKPLSTLADSVLSKSVFGGIGSSLQGGDFLKGAGAGALSGISGTLGNAIGSGLASELSPIFGKTVGDIFGGGVGGFSGNALKNILQGKSLDIGTALSTLQGATGGLSKLFSNTNEDKQTVNGPTSLAKTLQGVKNGPTTTSRRT